MSRRSATVWLALADALRRNEEHDAADDIDNRPHYDGDRRCLSTRVHRSSCVWGEDWRQRQVSLGQARRKRVPNARRVVATTAIVVVGAIWLAVCSPALGMEAGWRLAPALAPVPPAGVEPAPYGVPVGVVGEISFWAPNRGLLITGGSEAGGHSLVPSGIYAYDGVSWHQLSTVCGGREGRIVWAGPDEFWTISDQRIGQLISKDGTGETIAPSVSLCHFQGDEVVGSYAVPLDEPESWRQMTGGACYQPSDCWFGGIDGTYPHVGAFHLHWDGSSVTVVYEPEDHAVTSMTTFNGNLLESVGLSSSDARSEGEVSIPAILHTISPSGSFANRSIISRVTKKLLPEYGQEVEPEALHGFDLATNAPAGSSATQLWAVANPTATSPLGSQPGSLTILHDVLAPLGEGSDEEQWAQLFPGLDGPLPVQPRWEFGGSETISQVGVAQAIAPEPGSQRAWVSLHEPHDEPQLGLIEAATCEPTSGTAQPCGKLARRIELPEAGEEGGYHGESGPIDCPGPHDCWMATFSKQPSLSSSGWLFHFSNGEPEEPDTDPLFDGADGVITYRPPDSGVPGVYPNGFAEDDSLANQETVVPTVKTKPKPKPRPRPKARPLVKHVTSKLLDHRRLVIGFTLTAKAHVRLVGRRGRAVVAETGRETLRPGRHSIALELNPQRWPTALKFEAKPTGASGGGHEATEESGSGNVVGT